MLHVQSFLAPQDHVSDVGLTAEKELAVVGARQRTHLQSIIERLAILSVVQQDC